ncbi:MAG: DUF4474 domain-containing protein [Lachnospiraceae bacterium]|nr:DUF4474 domain-containing protein [Lachnospiraceae bacterium]
MYYALFILLFLALLCMILFHCRRKKIICRVCCMDKCRKCLLLSELARPFGYTYHCRRGFFSSTQDAWQKTAGYTWLYDYMASRFQMVIDTLPVYFDYQGKTWLIEFWKGQYGISTGAEIGIYHADRLLTKAEYKTALFHAVEDEEMLPCTLRLCNMTEECVQNSDRHWWLTAFLPGRFSKPSDLYLTVSLCFPDGEMRDAFYGGLRDTGCTVEDLTVQGLCVSFTYHLSNEEDFGILTRLRRRRSQRLNRIFCKLYLWVTRPFKCTEDRILYLYYYFPTAFRKLLRLHRFHRRLHKKNGSTPPKYCRKEKFL